MSYTIPRGKPLQAAVTISRILLRDASKRVKDTVIKLISEESEEAFQTKLITVGIRDNVLFHTTGGTHTIATKMFMENILTACLFMIVKGKKDVSNVYLHQTLGTTPHQISLVYVNV